MKEIRKKNKPMKSLKQRTSTYETKKMRRKNKKGITTMSTAPAAVLKYIRKNPIKHCVESQLSLKWLVHLYKPQ